MGEDDHALVEAVRRRDPAGLEGMYRRYADRLYTYARVLLRDSHGAADAVHDTFLAANSCIGQLRDPGQLRSWLYAIVRNECRRQLKVRGRGVPLDAVDEPAAEPPEPERAVDAGQVRELVHAAAAGLNPSDREVLDLAIRHDLSAPEVGAAMGLAPNHAHARISRARTQLERALGALIVARGGTTDCAPLAAVVDGWDGTLTPLLRKRISRHIDSCAVCARRRRDRVSPAALLAAYVPAFLVIGGEVWPKLVRTSSSESESASASASVGDVAARGRRRRAAAGVAAGTALVLLVGSGLMALGSGGDDRNRRAATPDRIAGSVAGAIPSPVPAVPPAAGRSGPPVTDPAAQATTSASARPSIAAPAPAGATPPAPTVPSGPAASAPPAVPGGAGALAVPFTVTARAAARCDGGTYTVTITATATATLAAAEVRSGGLPGGTRPMTVVGASARVIVTSVTVRSLPWTVVATAADGRTAQHAGDPVTDPCPPVVPG
jgi:RNA polymerase sigma factor (sigma-70 family)